MQRTKQLVALGFLLGAAACETPEPVWRGTLTLGPEPVTVTFAQPLKAFAATHKFCVVPVQSDFSAAGDSLIVPGVGGMRLRATLHTPDGRLDSLWLEPTVNTYRDSAGRLDTMVYRGSPPPAQRYDEFLCLWGRGYEDSTRVFSSVELRSDRPFTISQIAWWSGRRFAAP